MRYLFPAAVLLIGLATAAVAQEIPRYDPAGHCQRVGEVNSWPASMQAVCMRDQQRAYDKLKAAWSNVPEPIRARCDRVATAGGRGSYSLLDACLDTEYFSKKPGDNSGFKF